MRRDAARALLGVFVLAGCAGASETEAPRPVPPPLPLGDLLLVGFSGTQVDGNAELRRLVCDLKVGGLILFERSVVTGAPLNVVNPEQLARLTADVQALARRCAGRPLLIAADNEGGRTMRLSPRAGYRAVPSARELGEANDLARTELEARQIGLAMREAGINWNLAPVVDVAVNPENPAVVRPGRTFSADPERVTAHARAFIRGMHAAGILTALKHFPGHGSSRTDSHQGFTDVSDTADLAVELEPYRTLIQAGQADSVMPAHVFNRQLDPRYPASLSAPTVTGLLRGKLGYQGLVVSDDLLMGAVANHYGIEAAAVLALRAGVDVLLVSHNSARKEPRAAERVLDEVRKALQDGRLSREALAASLGRVEAFRARATAPAPGPAASAQPAP
ncbi:MAG: glycoside hydrolase family 3 [Candidatus Rokubacteria bacterium]|nr:glycoside hydrolase family 3 [Candidatus Rokubacteria bacterium]